MALGFRSKPGEWDFKCGETHQVAAPGSLHHTGVIYTPEDPDERIAEMPGWLLAWIEKNAEKQGERAAGGGESGMPVDDGFDVEDFLRWYGLAYQHEGDKFHLAECPFKGAHHTDGHGKKDPRASSILFSGGLLGWPCLATSCAGHGAGIGGLIRKLNETHEPYPKRIGPEAPRSGANGSARRTRRRRR